MATGWDWGPSSEAGGDGGDLIVEEGDQLAFFAGGDGAGGVMGRRRGEGCGC